MSYGKTLTGAELAEHVGQVFKRAASAAVELRNFPLGRCDVQCAFECWVADTVTFHAHTGRRLSDEERDTISGEVRAAIAQLGWEF